MLNLSKSEIIGLWIAFLVIALVLLVAAFGIWKSNERISALEFDNARLHTEISELESEFRHCFIYEFDCKFALEGE